MHSLTLTHTHSLSCTHCHALIHYLMHFYSLTHSLTHLRYLVNKEECDSLECITQHITGSTTIYSWRQSDHICISKLTIIGSDNGLSPGRRQAIIWTNDGILLTGPLGTNLSEILIKIHIFSFKKMHLKMSSAKWRPFYLWLNVLESAKFVVNERLATHWFHCHWQVCPLTRITCYAF